MRESFKKRFKDDLDKLIERSNEIERCIAEGKISAVVPFMKVGIPKL